MRLSYIVPVVLLSAALAGCASAPGIPDTTYYRLPPSAPVTALEQPVSTLPIVVETLLADGLYSDQALLYALDKDATRLRAYHYQLWVDPPVRLLQRRLIGALRAAHAADLVIDRLPAQMPALRVTGQLERFERIPTAEGGWRIAVALMLRVDNGSDAPLLVQRYAEEMAVAGNKVADSVQAIAQALDRIQTRFLDDLITALRARPPS